MNNITTVNDFIKKYEAYISNIEWHIKTNKPPEEEIKKLNSQIDHYNEALADLKYLSQNIVSNEWISIDDKLPNKATPVLIATKHWVGVGYYDKNFELGLEDEPKWSEENGEYIFEGSVTHWKELDKNPNNQ